MNHIDTPSHYYHYKYQRMVNRWFVFTIALLTSLQIVLNFTPHQILTGVFVTFVSAIVLFAAGGVLVVFAQALFSWLSGD